MKPIHVGLAFLIILIIAVSGCNFVPAVNCDTGIVKEGEKTLKPITEAKTTIEPETSRGGIPVKTVSEGDLVSFPNLRAVDPDGDKITYTFTDPLDEDGEWQTESGDAGEYKVVITASDGSATTKQEVIIKVLSGNNAPTIELDDVTVKEGEQLVLAPKVSDPDGDNVTVTYSGFMDSNTKETSSEDVGEHEVTVTASDGELETSLTVKVVVTNVNSAPIIGAMQDIALVEGDKIDLLLKVTDPDGDEVEVTYSEPFSDKGVWQTQKGDEGVHEVTITATDPEGLSDSITFLVAVEAVTKAPKITGPDTITVKEGETINLAEFIVVVDEDDEDIEITVSGFMDSMTKETGSNDAGEHEIVVTADDGSSDPVSRTFTVIVEDVNQAPVFAEGSFS